MEKNVLLALLILAATTPAMAAGNAGSPAGGSRSLGGWTAPRGGSGDGFKVSPMRDAWAHSPLSPEADRKRKVPHIPGYAVDRIPNCDVLLNPMLAYPIAYYPGQYCGTRVFVGNSIYASPWLPGAGATMFPLTVEY